MSRRPSLPSLHRGISRSMWTLTSERGSSAALAEKGKLTHLLKTTQLEQLSKLQNKHQRECDLLDDIRNFSKQRSQIEREYGQALQKLVLQYQKKDDVDVDNEDNVDAITTLCVWKAALNATDQVAQLRINQAENYRNNIYEEAKTCRLQKEIQLKKCQELLTTIHNELSDTVKDLSKTKKKYFELDQAATFAREKYEEVNSRLRKNQTSIFKSKSGLERDVLKLQQRCEESNCNSIIAKNEYLLTMSAANSHQKRYYEADLPEAIRILDGNIFDKLREYIAMISQYELDSCAETQSNFSKSLNASTKISRDYEARYFLKENPIFEWAALYEFEASSTDKSEGKLKEEQLGSDNSLNREARKWTFRVERDKLRLEKLKQRKDELSSSVDQISKNLDFSTPESEIEMEKCRQEIRKVETSLLLAESRVTLLRDTNVDTETWIESAKTQLAKEESLSTPGGLSLRKAPISQDNNSSNILGNTFSIGSPDEFFDDDDSDEFEENFIDLDHHSEKDDESIHSKNRSRNYPVTCTVIYPYEASRVDELTIAVGDKVEVIEDGDLDEWVKARDSFGNSGFVPENYLEFPSSNLAMKLQSLIKEIDQAKDSSSSESASPSDSCSSENDREVSSITAKSENPLLSPSSKLFLAKAIYNYEACTEDELSLPIGAVVNILSKNESGVDDGWWKGELNGKTGLFPALVVEELESNKSKQDSWPGSNSDDTFVFQQPPLIPFQGSSTSPNESDKKLESLFDAALFAKQTTSSPSRRGRLQSDPTASPHKEKLQLPHIKRQAPPPPVRQSLLQ